ncbi:MAG: GNAT family N-acetyltransferase [Candidatus Sumerlaeota bacterium]|nr:GNAT family N-acetyltransferase [Candidatus Sumerlaeota bacterium]
MIGLASLSEADAPKVIELFRNYPFRAFQQRRQGIDPDRLARMLYEQTQRAADKSDHNITLAIEGDTLCGIGGLAPDAWHSEIFEKKMGKIQSLVAYRSPEETGPLLLNWLLAQARANFYDHLSCRVDASDWNSIHALEKEGFYLVDGSQKLSRRLGESVLERDPAAQCAAPEGIALDVFREGEEDALAALASRSHTTNHFFNDPALGGAEAAERLFEEWVRRCCRKLARHVFVARRQGTAPMGFVTYLGADALKKHLDLNLIVLDFIVIDRSCQGQGLGRWLMIESLKAIESRYDWVELRTSCNNYPALSLYHRLGFETIASDVILHKSPVDFK